MIVSQSWGPRTEPADCIFKPKMRVRYQVLTIANDQEDERGTKNSEKDTHKKIKPGSAPQRPQPELMTRIFNIRKTLQRTIKDGSLTSKWRKRRTRAAESICIYVQITKVVLLRRKGMWRTLVTRVLCRLQLIKLTFSSNKHKLTYLCKARTNSSGH